MKIVLYVLLIAFPLKGFSQSFVFCPEIKTDVKQGLNDINISIVFKDSRVYEKKVKEKCTKNEIFNEFVSCIRRTYPDIKITFLDENNFDETPRNNIITIKIDLYKYNVTFYTGMYIANTKYQVKIFDYRNGVKIIQDTISGEGKQFNSLGFKSGKIASNSSFKEAFDKFVLLANKLAQSTNNQKMNEQITPHKNNNLKSKADRLRELKQLLDERVLTQEEYDKEKKKILDEKEKPCP